MRMFHSSEKKQLKKKISCDKSKNITICSVKIIRQQRKMNFLTEGGRKKVNDDCKRNFRSRFVSC